MPISTATTTARPSFETSIEEMGLIEKIVERIIPFAKRANVSTDKMTWLMDITGCHCNGTPLNLEDLLTAPDFDFIHDVFGIRSNIDRHTGRIMNHFLPRTARG